MVPSISGCPACPIRITSYPVRGKNYRTAGGHLGELIDEHRSESSQALHHVVIVNHLVAHVDRRTEELERPLDDVDGAIDAGTEAPRVGEQHLHQPRTCLAARVSRQASISSTTAPTVIAESARLNAGKYACRQCT